MTQFTEGDKLLKQARGPTKYCVLPLCLMLKVDKQSNNPSNEDITDMVAKDCTSIWQKATIRNVLPDVITEKYKQ
jgi:hypothetical protein